MEKHQIDKQHRDEIIRSWNLMWNKIKYHGLLIITKLTILNGVRFCLEYIIHQEQICSVPV